MNDKKKGLQVKNKQSLRKFLERLLNEQVDLKNLTTQQAQSLLKIVKKRSRNAIERKQILKQVCGLRTIAVFKPKYLSDVLDGKVSIQFLAREALMNETMMRAG